MLCSGSPRRASGTAPWRRIWFKRHSCRAQGPVQALPDAPRTCLLFGILRTNGDHYRLQNREIATADPEAPFPRTGRIWHKWTRKEGG